MRNSLKTLTIAGLAIILALLTAACGPSKEQLRQKDAKVQATATLAEIRQAPSGDQAGQSVAKLLGDLKSAGFGLSLVPVEQSELDRIVADKYFGDAKAQLAILRNRKAGPEAARDARAEFYRTQKASGRELTAFGVTAKGVEALAHRRAPAKKRPAR
jgi:hypothetical protein